MKDFVQARAVAEVLPPTLEPEVRARLLAKMSWYQTYTPVTPVRLDIEEALVSSLAKGWFPARRW